HFHLAARIRPVNQEGFLQPLTEEPFTLDVEGDVHLADNGLHSVDGIKVNLSNNRLSFMLTGEMDASQRLKMTSPATVKWINDTSDLTLKIEPMELSLDDRSPNLVKAQLFSAIHPDAIASLEWVPHDHSLTVSATLEELPVQKISPELAALFGPAVSGSILA